MARCSMHRASCVRNGVRPQSDALTWLIDWLQRRDDLFDKIKIDDVAGPSSVATELRREAEQPSSASAGLTPAATVLDDSTDLADP